MQKIAQSGHIGSGCVREIGCAGMYVAVPQRVCKCRSVYVYDYDGVYLCRSVCLIGVSSFFVSELYMHVYICSFVCQIIGK